MYHSYNSAWHIKALCYLLQLLSLGVGIIIITIKNCMSIFPTGENFFKTVISAPIKIKSTNIYIVLYSLQSIFMCLISCGKGMFLTLGNGVSTDLVGQG